MTRQELILMLAMKWEYKFSQDMTEEDHAEFGKECADLGIGTLEVIQQMEDYECI